VGSLREQEEPGWGFGFLPAVLTDGERAGSPCGNAVVGRGLWASWFQDPAAELSVVSLTNINLEGCIGSFPADAQASIYA